MSPTLFSTIEAWSKPDLTQQLLAAKKPKNTPPPQKKTTPQNKIKSLPAFLYLL